MRELNTRTKDLLIDYQQKKRDVQAVKQRDFQTIGSVINSHVKTLHETCPIHNDVHLRSFAGRVACPSCQREKVEAEEQERAERAGRRYHKRVTYDRLQMDSILSDLTLKDATFQSFVTDDDESRRNKQQARKIAGSYLEGETFNTLLTGTAGAGKSHLAMAILRAVNENSEPWRSCLFLSLDEFLLQIRSTFNNSDRNNHETEQTMIDRVANVDLMVLDDLGAETGFIGTNKKATDFTQRVLYNLMNKRQDKSTIITTNLNSDQVTDMYDGKIISRLYRRLEGHIITFENERDRRITF
ncbi:ATP-binding protein [Atopococcus tabaci]|uniref:ATP-binding protein n=1 Tax=Atopococcus tabaci TaxID=269774 RepID=UPI002409D6D2|nr:ATP-binding protein [Atopococcus tabaci]